jgi:hypothetical protein
MSFFIEVFTWLAVTAAFYPLVVVALVATYFIVAKSIDESDFPFSPLLVLGAIGVIAVIRYPGLAVLFQWPNVLLTAGAYLAIGFFVSLFKWIRKLSDFRVYALQKRTDYPEASSEKFLERVQGSYNSDYHEAKLNKEGRVYLPHDVSELTSQWFYWPFFILSVLFDPIKTAVNAGVAYFRSFYEYLSNHFSV